MFEFTAPPQQPSNSILNKLQFLSVQLKALDALYPPVPQVRRCHRHWPCGFPWPAGISFALRVYWDMMLFTHSHFKKIYISAYQTKSFQGH